MSPAALSLAALVAIIAVSLTSRLNVGVLAIALAWPIAMFDVSPLSTIGALCLAALPAGGDSRALFRQLLLWGMAMTVVGALFCQLTIHWFT